MQSKVDLLVHILIYVHKTGNEIKITIFVRKLLVLLKKTNRETFFCLIRQMRQWDIQQQVFKTSRLIRHEEYGTFNSNRGNISGRPSPSNSTPVTLNQVSKQTG